MLPRAAVCPQQPCCSHAVHKLSQPCSTAVQVVTKLHSILKPFLLRRVKTDVESALPGKLEVVLYAPMAPSQRKLNDQLLKTTLQVRRVTGARASGAPCG